MASKPTPQNRPAARAAGGKFAKGVSGNPGGRPKGLMQLVRAATRDGAELVEFALAVLRGEAVGVTDEAAVLPDVKDRLKALEWLGDRGFGKAPQPVEVKTTDALSDALRLASDEELEVLERLHQRAQELDAPEPGDDSGGEGAA